MKTKIGVLLIGLFCLATLGCQQSTPTVSTFADTTTVTTPVSVSLFSITVDGQTQSLLGPPQDKWKDGKCVLNYPTLKVGSGTFTNLTIRMDRVASSVEVSYILHTPQKWTILPVYPGPWSDVSWNVTPIVLNRTFNSMASAKSYISVTDLHGDGCFFLGDNGAFTYALDKRILCSQIKDTISKNAFLEVTEEFKPVEIGAVNSISVSAKYRVASGDKGKVKIYYLVRPLAHTGGGITNAGGSLSGSK